MKLGVFTTLLSDRSLEDALRFLHEKGVEAVEIGCGGYPGTAHADPEILLRDDGKLAEFQAVIKKYEMTISGLSCHCNPIHPNPEIAHAADETLTRAILLAEKLKVSVINTFSGCPGDHAGAKYPNWVTCPWPDEFQTILQWQWQEILIPYWKKKVAFAKAHSVDKIAFEMHPGFCVYNPETALRLREAVGPELGVNFDPSHLIWQGIDPVVAIKSLGKAGALFHFHAKDTKIDRCNTALNGVLDTKPYSDELNRSWIFRTIGYGNDASYWKEMISALALVGFDNSLSIEHEDSLMSVNEGLSKAIDFLNEVLIREKKDAIWWV
ncbi:MAG TPA: sugar phosphate isomerase/epimerase [Bacillota bacterium]|nr:sugar phosphate isomerase/epimerase [Bacillota bacterium]